MSIGDLPSALCWMAYVWRQSTPAPVDCNMAEMERRLYINFGVLCVASWLNCVQWRPTCLLSTLLVNNWSTRRRNQHKHAPCYSCYPCTPRIAKEVLVCLNLVYLDWCCKFYATAPFGHTAMTGFSIFPLLDFITPKSSRAIFTQESQNQEP